MELDDILNVLATSTDDERPEAIRDAVRAAAENGADMPGLEAAAVDRFRELTEAAEDSVPSDDQLGALEALVDVVEQLREYNVNAQMAAEAARKRLSALAGRVVTDDSNGAFAGDDDGDGDDDDDDDPDPEPDPDKDEDEDNGGGRGRRGGKKAVTASAPRKPARSSSDDRKLPLQYLRSKTPVAGITGKGGNGGSPAKFATGDDRTVRYTVTSADVPGISARQKLNDLPALASVVNTRMQSMVRSATSGRAGIATISRHVASKYMITQEMDIDRAIDSAANERNLSGGSLVAAGAWCAPPDTLWDLCPDDSGDDGYLDLPTVTTRRSGIRFPQAFDFSTLYGGVGFQFDKNQLHWSDCEDKQAEFKKCCIEIPCPQWTECLLELDGLCIRNSILMERGWPEWTADFTARVLKAHRRRMNAWSIAKVESLATRIQLPTVDPTKDPAVDSHGPGATESVLSIIEMMVEYQRYRYRLPRAATLELIAPYWLLPILRSDMSKKSGWNLNRWNVTDAQLISFLESRGVRVQFVYDWQDAFSAAFKPNRDACDPADCGCTPDAEGDAPKSLYPYSPGVYDCCKCTPAGGTPDPNCPDCKGRPVKTANEGRVLPVKNCGATCREAGEGCCPDKQKCWNCFPFGVEDGCFGKGQALFGGIVPSSWPAHVKLLLYPAGSLFKLQQDVITLEGIYDHASLMENKYTSLFTEEGVQVCKRCYDPYLLDIPLCPNGQSGAGVKTTCVPCKVKPVCGEQVCNDCPPAAGQDGPFTKAEKDALNPPTPPPTNGNGGGSSSAPQAPAGGNGGTSAAPSSGGASTVSKPGTQSKK
ncbi:major capsid protein [Streptomyces noursei]